MRYPLRRVPCVLVLLLLLVLSCAPPPHIRLEPVEKQRSYGYPFPAVWTSLIYLLNDWELPIKVIERESGVVVTDFVRFDPLSDFGRSAIQADILESVKVGRYTLNVLVMGQPDSSSVVRINAHVEKFSQRLFGRDYDWEAIPSTGYIERLLLDDLENLLGGTPRDDTRPIAEVAPTVMAPVSSTQKMLIAAAIFAGIAAAIFLAIP